MRTTAILSVLILSAAAAVAATAAKEQPPSNGPKATVVVPEKLYIDPDTSSTLLARIEPGREMVIVERNGPWLRVFANTDVPASNALDTPVFGPPPTPPISGWMEPRGVVSGQTPDGDRILFGIAATYELQASEPHPPQGAAQAARLLYERMAELFPQSPLTPEAEWRSADIRWQLQKADVFSLPSAHERQSYLREQVDETEMRRIEKKYPNSRWADLAAWDMLDNKICGDWQGSPQCPEKEADLYEKYAREHPNSPRAPQALYDALYRQGVLNDMYGANNDKGRAEKARARASALAGTLESKYPDSDYAARAAGLIYKIQQSIPIYGVVAH